MNTTREVHAPEEAKRLLASGESLRDVVFQNIDLSALGKELIQADVDGAIFLGCTFDPVSLPTLVARGGTVFPHLDGVPYEAYRTALYGVNDLFDVFDADAPCSYCNTLDAKVWRHWRDTGAAHPASPIETLGRRLHDYAIYQAMSALLAEQERVVAIMGGHSLKRSSAEYGAVAELSKLLAERGYFLASGGGPGAMEATHLGVWFANKPTEELIDAITILSEAPHYKDKAFLSQAFRVREKYPYEATCPKSLGVPTWLYGHEPPNPFASHIAKFFANSVREDGLVSIASHGIVFARGSAGTIQEIFQDGAQNYYGTVGGQASPMVFLGEAFWTEERPVYPLLRDLAEGKEFADLMTIGDDIGQLADFLDTHPPKPVKGSGWNVCDLHCQAPGPQ